MRIDYLVAQTLAERFGDAFYVFDKKILEKNYSNLFSAFNQHYPNTRIAYSYKTNYTPSICRAVDLLGGYAEVVSEMEFRLAQRLGVDSTHVIYNGPYKSVESIKDAFLMGCIVNLDSMRDIKLLEQIASENPLKKIQVGIRCNFQISEDSFSRFGIDVSSNEFRYALEVIGKYHNVNLSGIHCHFPDRSLTSFRHRALKMIEVSSAIFDEPPDFIDIGGGFFGELPYSLSRLFVDPIPCFDDYAETIGSIFSSHFRSYSKPPILFIEPGTALVADAMSFFARVINIKSIRDKKLIFVAGSIFNISPIARSLNLPVTVIRPISLDLNREVEELFDVVGYTCIEGDYLTKNLRTVVGVNDFLEYGNVGSYSIVMKPPFILPNVPILASADAAEDYTVIKRAESFDYPFENFI